VEAAHAEVDAAVAAAVVAAAAAVAMADAVAEAVAVARAAADTARSVCVCITTRHWCSLQLHWLGGFPLYNYMYRIR